MASEQSVRLIVEVIGAEESRSKLEQLVGAANSAFKNFQSAASTMASGVASFAGTIINAIGGMVKYVAQNMRWASLFVGQKLMDMTKGFIDTAAGVEQARVAFGTLVGEGAAGELLTWLTKYSLVTPVTREQLSKLTQTFLGYNHTMEETKVAVMATVEAASALGITETRLSAITYNLGQLATSTTASYREFRDLQKQGIFTAKLLAGAVADGTLKLEGFGKGTMVVGGATKKMTTAFEKSSTKLPELTKGLESAKKKLQELKDAGKEGTSAYISAEKNLLSYTRQVGEAKTSVDAYTKAEASRRTVTYDNISTLKELTREQQEMILKQNTGKEIAVALEEQMIKTYGGAAIRQVKTFAGAMSNFGDVWQYVIQRAMGISIDGQVKIGGAFDKIRNAAATLIEFLLANVDKIAGFFEKILSSKDALETFAIFLGSTFLGAILGIFGPVLMVSAVFAVLGLGVKKLIDGFMEGIPASANMRDAINKTGLTAGDVTKLLDSLGVKNSELAKQWIGSKEDLDKLEETLRKMGVDTLPEYISKLVEAKIKTAEQAEETKKQAEQTSKFRNVMEDLGERFKGVGKIFEPLTKQFQTLGKIMGQTSAGALLLKVAIALLGIALYGVVYFVTLLMAGFNALVIAISIVYEVFATLVKLIFGFDYSSNIQHIKDLAGSWKEVGTNMKGASGQILQGMMELATGTSEKTAMINGSVQGIYTNASAYLPQFAQVVGSNTSLAATAGIANACLLNEGVSQQVSFLKGRVETDINGLKTTVVTTSGLMQTETGTIFETMKGDLTDKADKLKTGVVGSAETMSKDSVLQTEDMMKKAQKAMEDGKPQVEKAAENVCSAVSSQFEALPGKASRSGRGVIEEFANNLLSKAREFSKSNFGNFILGQIGFNTGWLTPGINLFKQHGGIVPGPTNAPIPIIAHGGERIVSRTGVDTNMRGYSGNININFYGDVQMDSQQRADELAIRISKMLGRQNELARLGVNT